MAKREHPDPSRPKALRSDVEAPEASTSSASASGASIQRETVLVGALLITMSLGIAIETWRLAQRTGVTPSGPATVPLAVTAGLMIFSTLFLVEALRGSDKHLEDYVRVERRNTHASTVVKVMVILGIYAAVLGWLGYLLATTGLFAVVARILGSKRWLWNLGVGGGMAALAYFGFTVFLGVRLPIGVLGGI
jgi:putative tricarboxylic transport membrane protein